MKFLVIGDACRDVYIYGSTDRKNPEAAAPLLNNLITKVQDGMAANVANNLTALGAEVHTILPPEPWSEKERYVDARHGTQLLRVDYDRESNPLGHIPNLSGYDAVVVSDYGKGFVTHEILHELDSRIPLFIDTKKRNLGLLTAAWVKVNAHEHELIKTPPKNLVVTLGNRGSMYEGRHAPAVPIEVVDPCGAGDTYLAAFAWFMLQSNDVHASMTFANAAAAVTCQHRGTYAPTLEEIRR
jgi:bifunctional ADP-heptose synthase (sugar kinase/adenylyltransferase)